MVVNASLPMYDLPEIEHSTRGWWRGLAAAFRRAGVTSVPRALSRAADPRELWRAPGLLFSQTCGYPLTHEFADCLAPIAGPLYASLILVPEGHAATRLADLRGGVCAVNALDSQSGHYALRYEVSRIADGGQFFSRVRISGGHLASIRMVAEGEAEVCAVDCVTHALLSRYRPRALDGTRVLTRTARAPGLPYVTCARAERGLLERLREGLRQAFADPSLAGVRETLMLAGVAWLAREDYRCIIEMEEAANAAGYPELH